MSDTVTLAALKLRQPYRFIIGSTHYDRVYYGREVVGSDECLKLAKINGQLATSLVIDSITQITTIPMATPPVRKRRTSIKKVKT